jgi:hypothetical protein
MDDDGRTTKLDGDADRDRIQPVRSMTYLDDASANRKAVDHATAASNRIMSYFRFACSGRRWGRGAGGRKDELNVERQP